jgi:predicted TIM-barrel fold metal-dependent hydrolase
VIDFHVHQPAARADGELPYSAADYASFVSSLGIELSVTFTFDGLTRPGRAANDSLAAFVAGGRYVAFATVDPHAPDATDEIERCVREHDMRGIKLHPWVQGVSPQTPGVAAICETAASLRIPVLFHDGTPPWSTPLQLAALARRHPTTTIVLGHGGLHDLWREAAAAVESAPNLFICLCATPVYAMRALLERCPPERVLFGTDGGLVPEVRQRYVALRVRQLEHLELDPGRRRAMLADNPQRLLARA